MVHQHLPSLVAQHPILCLDKQYKLHSPVPIPTRAPFFSLIVSLASNPPNIFLLFLCKQHANYHYDRLTQGADQSLTYII